MEERHIQQLIQNLLERFEYIGEYKFDLDTELKAITHPITRISISQELIDIIEQGFLERIRYKRSFDGAILVPVSIVSDPKDHEEWYEEWLLNHDDNVDSYYWKRLEDYLSHELTRKYGGGLVGAEKAGEIVSSINDATYSIMTKLANPLRKEFNYKGLVVGYVQSGKTANFTALIAKAADAGYKFIIVLSGIHSVLRRQTQIRLDRELTGMNDLQLDQGYINEPSDIKRWNRTTTARLRTRRTRTGQIRVKDLGEFDTVNIDPFDSLCNRATPTIAIIKKNVKVLDRLLEYINQSQELSRTKMPLLIVDDEADQASVDGNANDPDSDRTTTNDRIRRLLALFPRKAYVGYTATPFANVLIDMATDDADVGDDLYPRNFIISLPEPNDYFGTNLIFQGDLSNRFIVEIPTQINGHLYNESDELLTNGNMTEYLSLAIDQFVLCCAVRNLRGDRTKPMSMLVHVSHRINDMTTVAGIISNDTAGREGYLQSIIGRYNDNNESGKLKEQFQIEWDEFVYDSKIINRDLSISNLIPEFDSIWFELRNVFEVLQVITLNSLSDDNLDYTTGQEMKVIAIGGNQLSRGLTLEGLMTSYYLRASRQYDTLLQMGRWFGYRKNYEDLTRIHTTEEIWGYFEHLAQVEEELRRDIRRYEGSDNTPADLALTILTHSRLAVTANNKLGAANLQQTSYSDSLHQTFKFPIDLTERIRCNLNLGESFISKISNSFGFSPSWVKGVFISKESFSTKFIFENFVDKYNFEERYKGSGVDINNLREYAFRRSSDNELQNWRVAVAGNSENNEPSLNWGKLKFNKINRSRIYKNEGYDCGVITDKKHLLADLKKDASNRSDGRDKNQALLLLYVINSESKGKQKGRVDLYFEIDSEKLDVLGFAIVLPKSINEPFNRIGQ